MNTQPDMGTVTQAEQTQTQPQRTDRTIRE